MSANERKDSARRCVFCGSKSNVTREHVLPEWLTEIGLDRGSSVHHSGPLNKVPRQWTSTPFRQQRLAQRAGGRGQAHTHAPDLRPVPALAR